MYTFIFLQSDKTKKISAKTTPIEKRTITDLPETQQGLVSEYRNRRH